MVLTHPACLMISLCGAAACLIAQRGWRGAAGTLWYVLPVVLLATAVNPAFSHRGATVLAYLPSGNPLTLESIAYGVGAGAMLAAVLLFGGGALLLRHNRQSEEPSAGESVSLPEISTTTQPS